MNNLFTASAAWDDPAYQQTALIVLLVIFIGAAVNFFFRKKNQYSRVAWASIKSWLVLAPLMFGLMGLRQPFPILVLTAFALFGAKVYFQIMGMFHQSYFVYICYAGIAGLGVFSQMNNLTLYNEMPMAVLGLSCLVPLVQRNYKNMIQYISLTLLGFIFLGWSFMHLALILNFESGLYQVMYLLILTEFCDNTNLSISRYFKGPKIVSEINSKRTWLSTLTAIGLTIILAYGMRHLLPDRSDKYWLAAGLIASFGGVVGDLVMSVIRRDAGVKIVGSFIIGRGDFLQRVDRLIFVAPIYYFVMVALS
ncbi:MAG: phosphatidate cytidylyltransferase [Bdellovibrionales bacterium RIFCSPHIGHO2_01_FULL_40_29]|nr:MAG: phosphatidate cytidylyltransferase [Bdellovibrionales bacterium RIFCSPHIGHO2_01_FULL_40_29]OFZ33854.1 MAG: phosphatidate cytidylyltransferase [Bdellovibrionales bacterium RIFCSPHIGHO2_02_FULL_40_15]